MNLVLIGYRGTGKSSVAELVGVTLSMPVLHMDDEVVRLVGCSIPEFVEQHGWDAFADLETQVVTEAARKENTVIDSGGGVVRRSRNMAMLKQNGTIFWLTAGVETIKERIKNESEERPPLTDAASPVEEVEEVLYARLPVYAEYADHIIETENRTLGEIAGEIVQLSCP